MSEMLNMSGQSPSAESLRNESEQKVLRNIAESKYPLSEEGLVLKERILSGAVSRSEIPTVEHPRPELFADLNVVPEQAKKVFGIELADIQVTKGCTHACEFCCVSADKKVDAMPFPALLKLAEMKKEGDRDIEARWQSWVEELKGLSGVDVAQFADGTRLTDVQMTYGEEQRCYREVRDAIEKGALSRYSMSESNALLLDALERHPIMKIVEFKTGRSASKIRDSIERGNRVSDPEYSVVRYADFPLRKKDIASSITNYYDSDPFDYKDRSFLHEDGTPADYGDVVQALASPIRPVHITTAGWSRQDKIAKRAAEKIASLKGKGLLWNTRISVNPTEIRARKDFDRYLADMVSSIETLADLHPEVLLLGDRAFNDKVGTFFTNTLAPDVLAKVNLRRGPVSTFSGRAKERAGDFSEPRDDHDVASCMPGYHIWPDGTVAMQAYELDYSNPTLAFPIRRGTRPTPTRDEKLWPPPPISKKQGVLNS